MALQLMREIDSLTDSATSINFFPLLIPLVLHTCLTLYQGYMTQLTKMHYYVHYIYTQSHL